MDNLLSTGLFVGFFLYWLLEQRPTFYNRWLYWWMARAPAAWLGKPFSCDLCMAVWGSGAIAALRLGWALWGWWRAVQICENCAAWPEAERVALWGAGWLQATFAGAAVAMLVARALQRLDVVILTRKAE